MKQKVIASVVVIGLIAGLVGFHYARQTPISPPSKSSRPSQYAVKKASNSLAAPGHTTAAASPSSSKAAGGQRHALIAHQVASINQAAHYVTIDNKQYPLRTYKPMMAPNDPLGAQWWVSNTHLDQSWDIPAGSYQTTLAIIDTGFDLKHEEFANRWYVNPGESGPTTQEAPSALNCTDRGLPISASCNLIDDNRDGIVDNETGPATYENPSRLNCTDQGKPLDKSCNRIDDDGNGYVDDVTGWDFMNNDNSPQAGELNSAGTGTQHGTWVAGIAAASGNNGKGIAGVDWNTKILPIQALDDDDNGDTLSVGQAIYYAINQHADVISISLGSTQPDDYVRGAVQAALKQGIVVVAAAGNDGCDCMVYPANYPEVVGVGALDSNNQIASFSSFGQDLDIMAPGTNLTSANYQSTNLVSSYASGLNGTSFSTPIISGMLTRLKSWQPTATPEQLIAALTENINRLSLPAGIPHDTHYGFGTLDADKAALRMTNAKTSILYAFTPVSSGNTLDTANPTEPAGNTIAYTCENGIVGATPIMEEIQGNSHFFTISQAENQHAVNAGYSSSVLLYACLHEPQDSYDVMHSINIFHEYRNDYTHHP